MTSDEQYMEQVNTCKARPEPARSQEARNLDGRFGRVLHGNRVLSAVDRLTVSWDANSRGHAS